jgi:hypothetical protein
MVIAKITHAHELIAPIDKSMLPMSKIKVTPIAKSRSGLISESRLVILPVLINLGLTVVITISNATATK